MDTGSLAWVGDAVYELYVREYVVGTGLIQADRLHRAAVKYVKADAQAHIMRSILSGLSAEEQTLVRRARNKRVATKPKNADPVAYKWATAFEALLGYYYLSGQETALKSTIQRAVDLIREGKV
jgi:ribonuclease-3 family protein